MATPVDDYEVLRETIRRPIGEGRAESGKSGFDTCRQVIAISIVAERAVCILYVIIVSRVCHVCSQVVRRAVGEEATFKAACIGEVEIDRIRGCERKSKRSRAFEVQDVVTARGGIREIRHGEGELEVETRTGGRIDRGGGEDSRAVSRSDSSRAAQAARNLAMATEFRSTVDHPVTCDRAVDRQLAAVDRGAASVSARARERQGARAALDQCEVVAVRRAAVAERAVERIVTGSDIHGQDRICAVMRVAVVDLVVA